jgi:hypothetical protein
VPMLASFLKRDLKNLIQRDASPNFQAQNGLLSLRSWWRSVRSLLRCTDECQVPSIVMTASRRVQLGARMVRSGDRLGGGMVMDAL